MNREERLGRYRTLLLEWNRKINLVGPEAENNVDEHIGEALEAAQHLPLERRVLDFGSGGGLPAVPLAIHAAGAATFHLVEADQRKWSFLKFVARECELKAVVHGDRLERLVARLEPDLRFRLVTSRAVGRPEQWLPLVRPYLEPEATVALFQRREPDSAIEHFDVERVIPLSRGEGNVLVLLRAAGKGQG